MKFDEAMARLEVIVKELDNQDLPLEKSIELFEEGLKLSTQTQSYLKSYEKRINKIVEEFQKEETNEEIN
ncbi:MAG TPA: exodeoxyribonuclease VII small subunit [Erysipelothrix sp.]|jgi:exodeoxyribonuclease VII small subunit|nr:exodeoxyribonuclease VII small subunit [Erysipelothrix sp.]